MNFLRQLLNPWIVLGSLLVGLLLIGAAFAILSADRPAPQPGGAPTADLAVIQAPTATTIVFTPPAATPTPTLDLPPAPQPGVLMPGAIVQIAGTGGEGLNLRASPGLNSNIQYLGFESEVFTIVEGPAEADGLIWWRIAGFSDDTRSGWAAANFLEIVQTP